MVFSIQWGAKTRMFIKPLCFLFAMLVSASAWSANYVYTGPYYTSADGIYTTSMRITGAFTTVNPLPPNLSNVEIGPYGQNLVTSWSFSNGVATFTTDNSVPCNGVGCDFVVSTDVVGNITAFQIGLRNPRKTDGSVDEVAFIVGTSPIQYQTWNQPACFGMVCPGPDAGGWAETPGSFTTVQVAAVPTLSPGGVLLLVGLMAIAVGFVTRRKSN